MKKSRISFGPGAASLILIMVVLTMSVLGILSLMSARGDYQFCERSVRVIEAGYALNVRAEEALAELDEIAATAKAEAANDAAWLEAVRAQLPQDMIMEGREILWEETDSLRTLECAVELLPMGETARLRWTAHRLTAVTEDIWN